MKSSGNSSAPSRTNPPANPSSGAPSRKRFALTGPSRPFDPRTTAARADLADIRVADRVFAPHYAAPLPRAALVETDIVAEKGGDVIGRLTPGDVFEVLELTATHAWGVAPDGGVGYVPLSALAAS